MQSRLVAFILAVQSALAAVPDRAAENGMRIIDGKAYVLTFEDCFDGTELDYSKWERCSEQRRQDMNNYWDDSMSYLDGEGHLVLGMDYDEENDRYISGAIRSRGLFEQAYGYFEIKCRINTVPGYWTAFWLMGDSVNNTSGGGVNGTEIDIYESPYCGKGKIQHTLNWDGYGQEHKYEGYIADADVYDGEYHTFGLLWTEEEYVFYIDGEESWRTEAKKARGTCQVPLYMKISAEAGGWTEFLPLPETLPDCMMVDHVRVYSIMTAENGQE